MSNTNNNTRNTLLSTICEKCNLSYEAAHLAFVSFSQQQQQQPPQKATHHVVAAVLWTYLNQVMSLKNVISHFSTSLTFVLEPYETGIRQQQQQQQDNDEDHLTLQQIIQSCISCTTQSSDDNNNDNSGFIPVVLLHTFLSVMETNVVRLLQSLKSISNHAKVCKRNTGNQYEFCRVAFLLSNLAWTMLSPSSSTTRMKNNIVENQGGAEVQEENDVQMLQQEDEDSNTIMLLAAGVVHLLSLSSATSTSIENHIEMSTIIANEFQVNANEVRKVIIPRLIDLFVTVGVIHASDVRNMMISNKNGSEQNQEKMQIIRLSSNLSTPYTLKCIRNTYANAMKQIEANLDLHSKAHLGLHTIRIEDLSKEMKLNLRKSAVNVLDLCDYNENNRMEYLDSRLNGISLFPDKNESKVENSSNFASLMLRWELDEVNSCSTFVYETRREYNDKDDGKNITKFGEQQTESYQILQWISFFYDNKTPTRPKPALLRTLSDIIGAKTHEKQCVLPYEIFITLNSLLTQIWGALCKSQDDMQSKNGKTVPRVSDAGELIIPPSVSVTHSLLCEIVSGVFGLYYTSLQSILQKEMKAKKSVSKTFLSVFHKSLFVVCTEAILHLKTYTSSLTSIDNRKTLTFPFVLQMFGLDPLEFLLSTEPFVSSLFDCGSDGNSCDEVPIQLQIHLNQCDDHIISALMWQQNGGWVDLIVDLQRHRKMIWPQLFLSNENLSIEDDDNDYPKRNNAEDKCNNHTEEKLECGSARLKYVVRKLLHILEVRVSSLCNELYASEVTDFAMELFRSILAKHLELLLDRHIDQLILCCIYACSKVACVTPCVTMRSIVEIYLDQIRSQMLSHQGDSRILTDPEVIVWQVNKSPGRTYDLIEFYNKAFLPEVKPLLLDLARYKDNQLLRVDTEVAEQNQRKRKLDLFGSKHLYEGKLKLSYVDVHPQKLSKNPRALFSFGEFSNKSTSLINEVVQRLYTPKGENLYPEVKPLLLDLARYKDNQLLRVDTEVAEQNQRKRKLDLFGSKHLYEGKLKLSYVDVHPQKLSKNPRALFSFGEFSNKSTSLINEVVQRLYTPKGDNL